MTYPVDDYLRICGASTTAVLAIAPTAITDTTPLVSDAIDLYPSAGHGVADRPHTLRVALVAGIARTSGGVTFTVTESDASDGDYTAAETFGDLTKLSADGVRIVGVTRNPAKPYLKVTATGDTGSMASTAFATLCFV